MMNEILRLRYAALRMTQNLKKLVEIVQLVS